MTPRQRQAAELYQSGKSLGETAAVMGCIPQAVSRLLQRAGVATRPQPTREKWDSRKAEIEYLYNTQGMSQTRIAEYFGVNLVVVQRVMKRLGIASKSKGRGGRQHYRFKTGLHVRDYRKAITKDKCRKCGATEDLGIHHKNDDHFDNRLENLEVLCNSCHMSETKRKWWAAKKSGKPLPKSNGPVGWRRKSRQ